MKRALASRITEQRNPLLIPIPNDDGEVANQMLRKPISPSLVSSKDKLRIADQWTRRIAERLNELHSVVHPDVGD
jgi:hypothetical protein